MASISLLLALFSLLLPPSLATTFHIINNCSQTIWPASFPYGGGLELSPSQNWTIAVPATATSLGRIWARTNCTFDTAGRGTCLSGDCAGSLNCTANGSSPSTAVEYALNQWGGGDYYGITLVNGYNVPVDITPIGPGNCSAVRCAAEILEECPGELRAAGGGCRSPCDVYKTAEYCCDREGSCLPTKYSRFFKRLCPNACSYQEDVPTSTYTCKTGDDYKVTFCP